MQEGERVDYVGAETFCEGLDEREWGDVLGFKEARGLCMKGNSRGTARSRLPYRIQNAHTA